jgi:hypothetical protein
MGSHCWITETEKCRHLMNRNPVSVDQVHNHPLPLRQGAQSLRQTRFDPDLVVLRPRDQGRYLLSSSGTALADAKEVSGRVGHLPYFVPSLPCHGNGLCRRLSATVRSVGGHQTPPKTRFYLGDERPKAFFAFGPRLQQASSSLVPRVILSCLLRPARPGFALQELWDSKSLLETPWSEAQRRGGATSDIPCDASPGPYSVWPLTTLPHIELPLRDRGSQKRPLFAAAITVVVEIVLIWATSEVEPSLTTPVLLVLAVGIIGVGVTILVDSAPADQISTRRRGPHPAWLAVVGTIVMMIAGFSWILSFKMWMAEGAATQVANRLMDRQTCSTSPADLGSVGSLMSATKVCGYYQPDPLVLFDGHPVVDSSTGDQVEKGLLYAPGGFEGIGMTCVRHLVGSWWVFQDLIVECPSGYQVVGSSP